MSKLSISSSVLDSGTGTGKRYPRSLTALTGENQTGAWVMDLAKSVPSSVELYGSDVSSYHFSRAHPANVHFVEASSTKFPKDWTGKFDIVDQRLLVAALRTEEWPVVLSDVLRVLKPGGYAQFAEMDCKEMFVNGGPACRRYLELCEKIYEKQGLFLDAAQQMPHILEEAGFTGIVSEKKLGGVGDSWVKIGKMGAVRNPGTATVLVKAGVIAKDELAQLVASLEDGFEKAEGTQLVYCMVCARKPAHISNLSR